MNKFFATTFLSVFCALFFCGCPAELKIAPNSDGTFTVQFNSVFGEKLTDALKDLTEAAEQLSETPKKQNGNFNLTELIDTKKVEQELNSSCFNSSQIKIQPISQGKAYNFILNAKTKKSDIFENGIISHEKVLGKSYFVVTINTEFLQKTLLKENTVLKTLADVLMAPLVSGEEMSRAEYEDLLVEIFGETVTQELLSGDFKLTVVLPNKKTVSQSIPMSTLLLSGRGFAFEY